MAEQHLAACVLRIEPVEQGGPRPANVQVSGGGGGKAGDDGGHGGLAGIVGRAFSTARLPACKWGKVRIAALPPAYYISPMKTLVVRIPESVAAEIETIARARGVSKSEVARERLARPREATPGDDPLASIRDLIGSVESDDLPTDLSARKKHYLKAWGFGKERHR